MEERKFESRFFGGCQGVRSFFSCQAENMQVCPPADETPSLLVESSHVPLQTQWQKSLWYYWLLPAHSVPCPCPPEPSCLPLQDSLSLSLPANREFCTLDFQVLWRAQADSGLNPSVGSKPLLHFRDRSLKCSSVTTSSLTTVGFHWQHARSAKENPACCKSRAQCPLVLRGVQLVLHLVHFNVLIAVAVV